MDDLAPAPTQRTFDDAGRVRDEGFRGRKKVVKKAPPVVPPAAEMDPEMVPEAEPESGTDHQLDLLA